MFKLVVFTPLSHAEQVRLALGEAGAGKIGNYSYCSFALRGVGRFRPLDGANPHIGEVNKLEEVEEERLEVVVEESRLEDVLTALRMVHPYEEVAFDLYRLEKIV